MYGLDETSLIANKGKISEEQQKKNYKELVKLNLDLPFDIDLVEPECHACVLTQIKKYKKFVDDQGISHAGKFIVPCEGITISKIFNEEMKSGFTEEQWDEVKAQSDIVHWARKYLKLPTKEAWKARWYQEQVLRCTSRRKVLRISRRAGKCIAKDSKIVTSAGRIKAKDFYKLEHKPFIVAFNEKTSRTEMAEAHIVKNGMKEVFELKTKNGRETSVTSNHPFLIQSDKDSASWEELKDINIGDKLAVPSGYSHVGNLGWIDPVGERKARLLGYLTGDGGTSHKIITRFTNFDKEIVDDISDIVSDYNCELNEIAEGNFNIVGSGDSYRKRDQNQINKIVNNEGLRSLAKHKVLPKSIENAIPLEIANFLGAYWDCDGWVSIAKKPNKGRKNLKIEIGACSASKELMLDIKHLLLRLDINSNLVEKRVKYNDGINLAWQLTIGSKEGIMKFCETIPLRAKEKRLKEAYELIKDRRSNIQYKEDYFWDTVKSITPIGKQETYDLTVPTHQTLIADDIISHNTDMVCVEICFYLFTQPNIKIVVAGPQKTHTEEIINRVRSFINSNSELSDCVVKDISAPYYKMKLTTGAELRGFAAGGRGKGGDGSSIRGQDADRLYLEEMDYIAEDSITGAVLPLLQTKEETYMVGFSTPSGMQTPYYNFCEKTPACKEFQHSYLVLPHYKAVEADRSNFTEEKWTHEFLAQWGSSESGVYKPKYIDDAIEMYKYTDHRPMPGWKYCIGTDWNEKHGTEIAVVGWNPFRGKFTIVDTERIEASQFTQLEGVKRLLQVNKKWKPDFVYIDAGNGSTNYELIMKKALNARGKDPITAGLLKTLKKYDSGAAVETKDPVTHQLVRKPAKSFMINASVRMFEQGLIVISGEDVVLDKQLRNYIIERYTPTGNPVYGLNEAKVGDHRLDAMNLALVAFHKEFDELHKTNNICTDVGAAPDPRNIKAQSFRGESTEGHTAEERRLDSQPKSVAESIAISPLAAAPAKLDKTFHLKTNRVGWATDEEDKFMAQAMQRKRGRQNLAKNRPTRTTF